MVVGGQVAVEQQLVLVGARVDLAVVLQVQAVRIGKYLEIEVDEKAPNLDSRLNDLCRDSLSNPVIEDYEVVK